VTDPRGLRGVTRFADPLLTDRVVANLRAWLPWALLDVGAYRPVAAASPAGKLAPAADPRYPARTRFEGGRGDWAWEDPTLRVSGVTVGGSAAGSYEVDYPGGAVVFPAAVAAGQDVRASFASREVSVVPADGPWFLSVLAGEGKPPAPENRLALPAIALEAALGTSSVPWELGNTAFAYTVPVLAHVVAASPAARTRLHDLLCKQKDAVLFSFDPALAPPPVDALGRLAAGARAYPDLCRDFPWERIRLTDCRPAGASRVGESLWLATVRLDCEVVAP
jgi:hypothetical protein